MTQLVLLYQVNMTLCYYIQMFLSSMECILMVKMHSSDYIRIIFNILKAWYLFYSSLDSIKLANQILPQIKQVENDDNPLVLENEDDYAKLNDKNWSSITVNDSLFDEVNTELIMNNYPHVQLIHIQGFSFSRVFSLTISNLPFLRIGIIEYKVFCETTRITLEGILL